MARHKATDSRCASCAKWKSGTEWHSNFNGPMGIHAWGTCTGTGKPKLNAAYACKFYERGNRGIFISGQGVPREFENISMDENETDND